MSVDDVLAALFGSVFFWAFVAGVALWAVTGGAFALASRAEHKREQKRYSAEAYEQLRGRQEFKRIVAEDDH